MSEPTAQVNPKQHKKPHSHTVTDGIERAASRGMLRAVGMGDDDWRKPQIGVASSWNEITPCNLSLDRLAKQAKVGVRGADGFPLEFGTISVSDGISMGHDGMHYSLVSREIIADSVETVIRAEQLDGAVLLAGCDKSLPGMLMAAARLDIASVFLYAGSTLPGKLHGNDVTIIDAFEGVGACLAGKITRDELNEIEKAICPGEGACGGMYTANTMASAAEALGMSLTGSAAPPAPDARRDAYAERSGEAVVALVDAGITARQILTMDAFENAITLVMALGGSTNAVLHLLAIAREAEVDLNIADFNRIGDKVPHIADMKPFGRYVMTDIDRIGGIPVVMRALLDAGLLHGDALTVTGKTLAENLDEIAPPQPDGQVIRPLATPIHRTRRPDDPARFAGARGCGRQNGRLRRRRVRGHRAGVRPRAGSHGRRRGRDAERGRHRRHPLRRARRAGPGCARCWPSPGRSRAPAWARTSCSSPTAASRVGRLGLCIGHVAPEASVGGPIAFVADGDKIVVDIANRTLELLRRRRRTRTPAGRLDADPAEVHPRRPGQVRQAGRLGRERRRLHLTRGFHWSGSTVYCL